MKYKQAMEHWKVCKLDSVECIYGCGELIMADSKDAHKALCRKNYQSCDECEGRIYFLDTEVTHNCLTNLIERGKNMQRHNNVLNYTVANKCKNNHEMKRELTNTYGYGYVICNECSRKQLEIDQLYYQCKQCKYDLCRGCAIKSILPETDVPVLIHEHPLNRGTNDPGAWMCCNTAIHGKCFSGISSSEMSKNHQQYRCSEGCEFFLCLNCTLVQKKN